MRDKGIRPDSFAAEQVSAAREQGKSDKAEIEHMKLACCVVAAAATGGLGAGGLAGFATSAAGSTLMNAGSLAEKSRAVDMARDGEVSGTMREGSADIARRNLHVAQVAFAAEVVGGGIAARYGSHAVGHPFLEKLGEEGAHHVAHGIIEGSTALSAGSAELAASKENE